MVEKEFKILNELIRSAYNALDPVDKYSYLYHKNIVDSLYGRKPECFLSLKRKEDGGPMGQNLDPYLIPVCNRAGFEDRDIIKLSLQKVQQMIEDEDGNIDINDLKSALTRLQHRHNVYSKTIPKPAHMAGHKANTTRMLNNIKKYLKRD